MSHEMPFEHAFLDKNIKNSIEFQVFNTHVTLKWKQINKTFEMI